MKKNSILINLTDSFNSVPKYIITNKSKCYDSDGNETECDPGCPENAMDYYSDRNKEIQKATESNTPKPDSDFAKAKEELKKVCEEEGETDEDREAYLARVKEQATGRYNDFVIRDSGGIDAAGEDEFDRWVDSQLFDATQYRDTQLPPYDWTGFLDPLGATPLGRDDELKMSPEDAMYTVGGFSAATLTAAQLAASKAAEQQLLVYLNDRIQQYNMGENNFGRVPLLRDVKDIRGAINKVTFKRDWQPYEIDLGFYGRGKSDSPYINVHFYDFVSNQPNNIEKRSMEFLAQDVLTGNPSGTAKAAAAEAFKVKQALRSRAAANKKAEATLFNKTPKFLNTGTSKGCTIKERAKGALTNRIGWLGLAVTAAVAVFARNCQAAELEENKNLNEECSRKNQKIKAAKDKFDEEKKKIEDKQKKDVDDIKKDKPDLPADCVPAGTQGADPDTGIWPQGDEPIGEIWDIPSVAAAEDAQLKAEAARRAKEKLAKELESPCDIKEIDCTKYTIIDPMNHGGCP